MPLLLENRIAFLTQKEFLAYQCFLVFRGPLTALRSDLRLGEVNNPAHRQVEHKWSPGGTSSEISKKHSDEVDWMHLPLATMLLLP